jgi:hypothetical protein
MAQAEFQIPFEDKDIYRSKYETGLREGYKLDSCGTGYGLVQSCCDHGDEDSTPI